MGAWGARRGLGSPPSSCRCTPRSRRCRSEGGAAPGARAARAGSAGLRTHSGQAASSRPSRPSRWTRGTRCARQSCGDARGARRAAVDARV
eukprot:7388972-Prymnesium_polylepis.1